MVEELKDRMVKGGGMEGGDGVIVGMKEKGIGEMGDEGKEV